MIKIIGVGPRWLAVAGAVVLAAAAACQSAPDHGLASPATAPATAPATTPGTGKAAPPADRAAVEPAAPPSTAAAPTTGDSGKAPPQPIPPALPRCHTADLALEVGQSDSATSHTGLNLALVNRSTHRCRIYGYGGIQLLDAAGAALPTHQDRGHPTPTLLTLRPGDRAYSALLWISNTDAVPCFAASALQVIPPDETEPIRASFTHTVCGNGVVGQGAYRSDPT